MKHFYILFCFFIFLINISVTAEASLPAPKIYFIGTGYKYIFLGSSFSGATERRFETEYFTFGKYLNEKYSVFAGISYISNSRKPTLANEFHQPYSMYHIYTNYDTFQSRKFDVPIYAFSGLNYETVKSNFTEYFGFKLGRFPGEYFESWQGSPYSLISPNPIFGDKASSWQNYERKLHRSYSAVGVLELHFGWKYYFLERLCIGLEVAYLLTTPNRKTVSDTYIDLNRIDGGDTLQLILLNKFMNWSRETGGSIGSSFSLGLNYIF